MKKNTFADEVVRIAMRQLRESYQFKIPRLARIRKFRDLYNGFVPRQWRVRYNAPIPVFSGIIDTLQSGLDDDVTIKFQETDPADWKAAQKANAAITQEADSMRPGAKWNSKFRLARQECLMTGRGILKYTASSENGFSSTVSNTTFEDFFFEPKGGGQLENHLFAGEKNIWKTKFELEEGAKTGLYDKNQVNELIGLGESDYKRAQIWEDWVYIGRFEALGLSPIAFNYVGVPTYHLAEWVTEYKGQRWYVLFEVFTGTWIRFEKLTDVNSSGLFPWLSFASHEDAKNFASKGYADDLYPHAVMMSDFLNEDMENKRRMNSNARAYDKDMFPNVQELDQAQMGRDKLVEADTKNGTKRIADGLYHFETPEISGTIDTLNWMEQLIGRNYGVNDLQKGAAVSAAKTPTVAAIEMNQVSNRLSFVSHPMIEASQELGIRFFGGLKDYLKEPMAIKLLGERGYEWDVLRRVDLNIRKDFEILVTSQSQSNKQNLSQKASRSEAITSILNNPLTAKAVNPRVASEYILRDVGEYTESEIALLLDTSMNTTKEMIADASSAIQDLLFGRKPAMNYNADYWFLQKLLDFTREHQEELGPKYKKFLAYIQSHEQIALQNTVQKKKMEAMAAGGGVPPMTPNAPEMPQGMTGQPPMPPGMPAGAPPNAPQLSNQIPQNV